MYEAVSPMFALTASAPSTPEIKSNVVAKSAVATTSICLDIVALLVIATTKFCGALKETTSSTEAEVFNPPKPFAVTPTVWLPSA